MLAVVAEDTFLNRRIRTEVIPQKSPTFFQRASGDSGDDTVMLDSNASAETLETMTTVIAAMVEFMRIARFPSLR